MTLAQIIQQANAASYFSRTPDEVLAAISNAGRKVYRAAEKELRQFARKLDTTSVATVVGQLTYQLPADVSQVIQIAEQPAGSAAGTPWSPLTPLDENNAYFVLQGFDNAMGVGSALESEFSYSGPYVDAASLMAGAPRLNIDLSPIPQDVRPLRIIYAARFLEVSNAGSVLVIPEDATVAVLYFAIAELLRRNADGSADGYKAEGKEELAEYLQGLRDTQVQGPHLQMPYLEDMD